MGSRQYGIVTASQLHGLGLTPRQLDGWVLAGRLTPVRRGLYRLAGSPASWHGSVLAAVLAAGDPAVASHNTAAELWRLSDRRSAHDPMSPGCLHLTASRRVRLEGVVGHVQTLTDLERAVLERVPVTSVARTLLDMAGMTDAAELGEMTDQALRRGILNLDQLRRLVDAHSGHGRRRLGPIREVLGERVAGYDPGANAWEARMDQMWDRVGLPPAVRQYRLVAGGRTYRPDRAIVELKIAVDWNGYQPHGAVEAFHRDSNRRADMAAIGWFPLDFTARSSPERICRTVMAVVAQRRAVLDMLGRL